MKKTMLFLLFVWSTMLVVSAEDANKEPVSTEFSRLFTKGLFAQSLKQTQDDRLKALSLWRLGRVDELKKLVSTSRNLLIAGDNIRLTLLQKGPKEAVKIGKKMLQTHPDNSSLYVEVVCAAIESGDIPTLKELMKIKTIVKNYDALAFERMVDAKVKVGYLLGQPDITRDAVVNLCEEGIKRFPWNPRFNVIRCLYYYRIGQRIDAGDFVEELKKDKALDPLMLFLPPSEEIAKSVIPPDPKVFESNLVVMRRKIQSYLLGYESFAGNVGSKNAENLVSKLEKLAPKHPDSIIYRAAIEYVQSKEQVYPQELSKLTVRNGGYWFMMANLVAEPFDRRPALPYARSALENEPWQVDWMVFHAFNCHREGYEAEALKFLKQAYKLEPRLPKVYNLKRLLESMEENYLEERSEHFRVFMRKDEHKAFKLVLIPELEKEYDSLAKRYDIKPKQFIVKLFSDKQDFDVSVFAVPSAPAIGACMGRLVTMPAPSYLEYKLEPWASVLRHELAHAFHIERSKGRVSRWFTEGLAHYEEVVANPSWDWEAGYDQQLVNLKASGKLAKFGKLNPAFNSKEVRFYYQYCRWIMEWLDKEKGWKTVVKCLDAYATGVADNQLFPKVLGLSNEEAEAEFWKWLTINVYSKIPYPALMKGPMNTESGLAYAFKKGEYIEILSKTKNSQEGISLLYRAMVVEELDGGEEAESLYGKAANSLTNHFTFNYKYGRNLYEGGSYEKAEKHLLKAIEIYPLQVREADNPYYWLYLIYKDKKEVDKAISIIWDYTRIQQKDHRARFYLVRRYMERNNYKKVQQLLKEITDIYPYHFEAILWEADQAKRQGNKQLEKTCYQRLFACAVLEDLVDQETLWSDKERLAFLKKAIDPWLSLSVGEEKIAAAEEIEKYFPNHPEVVKVLKMVTK